MEGASGLATATGLASAELGLATANFSGIAISWPLATAATAATPRQELRACWHQDLP